MGPGSIKTSKSIVLFLISSYLYILILLFFSQAQEAVDNADESHKKEMISVQKHIFELEVKLRNTSDLSNGGSSGAGEIASIEQLS